MKETYVVYGLYEYKDKFIPYVNHVKHTPYIYDDDFITLEDQTKPSECVSLLPLPAGEVYEE